MSISISYSMLNYYGVFFGILQTVGTSLDISLKGNGKIYFQYSPVFFFLTILLLLRSCLHMYIDV